jgi:hypothetical protein
MDTHFIDLDEATAHGYAQAAGVGASGAEQQAHAWDAPDLSLLGTGRRAAPVLPLSLLGSFWADWVEKKARAASGLSTTSPQPSWHLPGPCSRTSAGPLPARTGPSHRFFGLVWWVAPPPASHHPSMQPSVSYDT